MKKILMSWIATQNDFKEGAISPESPNYNIHKYYYNHDVHYLFITSGTEYLVRAEMLKSRIRKEFSNHNFEIYDLKIKDPINVMELKDAVQFFLINKANEVLNQAELTAYISPGTPSMQVAWYLIKLSSFPQLTLVQGRGAIYSKNNIPSFEVIDLVEGNTTMSLVTKEVISSNYSEKYPVDYDSIKKVYDDAVKVANAPFVSALITGSTGTGKENLACYIHNNSSNKGSKFLAINCSAFSDNLLESRLFGYEKGAFTGAFLKKTGIFEDVDGGTVFLDEIGDITPYMQQSLLRVLQEKEVLPIGSSKPKKVRFRLICATNKDLVKMCIEQKFRWDLYYRITTTILNLPDLIEWQEKDRKKLIQYFIEIKAVQFNKSQILLTQRACSQLLEYSFPGNIRELENIIENLYIFNSGPINNISLPEIGQRKFRSASLNEIEKEHIKNILEKTNFNYTKTAKILGIAINTLKSKIKQYNIEYRKSIS